LKFKEQDNWTIVLETDKPFELSDLYANNQKILNSL
jgi:hypothetical protein